MDTIRRASRTAIARALIAGALLVPNAGCLDLLLWSTSELIKMDRAKKSEMREDARHQQQLDETRELKEEIRRLKTQQQSARAND